MFAPGPARQRGQVRFARAKAADIKPGRSVNVGSATFASKLDQECARDWPAMMSMVSKTTASLSDAKNLKIALPLPRGLLG